ncbi:MAG TPA: 16S rRNA (guanine(966)-N(2))-methyltransferase RsmD [Sphingomicrobium sp.]|nr:16S rRNA (guanine(966)-N(2))-methyltransferase RsmD [Sphingomicrobium sp.]
MRIVAGRWRGRKLAAPTGQATRPTADRTRETLFNMLTSRIGDLTDLAVADLYAGSGALGLEAMSRGAATVTFVETDLAARQAIAANVRALGAEGVSIVSHSAEHLPPSQSFDLVLADPPYGSANGSAVVRVVLASGWLVPGGWLAVETKRGEPVDPATLDLAAERDTGAARLTLLRRPV